MVPLTVGLFCEIEFKEELLLLWIGEKLIGLELGPGTDGGGDNRFGECLKEDSPPLNGKGEILPCDR